MAGALSRDRDNLNRTAAMPAVTAGRSRPRAHWQMPPDATVAHTPPEVDARPLTVNVQPPADKGLVRQLEKYPILRLIRNHYDSQLE